MASTVIVNGKKYTLPGGNVSVIGNKVYCNGKLVEDCNEIKEKNITVVVNGNIDKVSSDVANIVVNGNANYVETDTGDIKIAGDVSGNVSSDTGDIRCGNIGGNAETSTGDISHSGIIGAFKKIKKSLDI